MENFNQQLHTVLVFSTLYIKYLQSYRLKLFHQCLNWRFSTFKCCFWFIGAENWYAENVKDFMFVWHVLKQSLDSFHNNIFDFVYHGLNQQFFICRTSLKDKNFGKDIGIAYFVNRESQNMEPIWSLLKKKLAFLKNQQLYSTQHCIAQLTSRRWNLRECQLLLLGPRNATLMVGKRSEITNSDDLAQKSIRFFPNNYLNS